MAHAQLSTQKKIIKLMGSRFEITAIHPDPALANTAIQMAIDEITRIERMISSWDSTSQTSTLNRHAGKRPVKVSEELFQLIHRSKKVSQLTSGAFDISFAALDSLWQFDDTMEQFPTKAAIQAVAGRVDYRNIVLDASATTVFLKKEGMKISFGAIGKGYAANRAKLVLKQAGIANGLVNAGGDLISWGKQADGEDWKIGIANPKQKKKIFSWLSISDMSVVTSGDYEKFFTFQGRRYAHIIDPRTGYPVKGMKSVTIVCPDAELGDALATAVFVLGEERGLQLVNQLRQVECLLVNDRDELISSDNLQLHYYKKEGSKRKENPQNPDSGTGEGP